VSAGPRRDTSRPFERHDPLDDEIVELVERKIVVAHLYQIQAPTSPSTTPKSTQLIAKRIVAQSIRQTSVPLSAMRPDSPWMDLLLAVLCVLAIVLVLWIMYRLLPWIAPL
jgi:hypothetical protein